MRTLTAHGIGVVIVLALFNSRAWQAGMPQAWLHSLNVFSAGFALGVLGTYIAAWLYGYRRVACDRKLKGNDYLQQFALHNLLLLCNDGVQHPASSQHVDRQAGFPRPGQTGYRVDSKFCATRAGSDIGYGLKIWIASAT